MLLTAGEGRADYYSGQALNEACSEDDYFSDGICKGYVTGVYDAGIVIDEATYKRLWEGGWTACVPDGVSAPDHTKAVAARPRGVPRVALIRRRLG